MLPRKQKFASKEIQTEVIEDKKPEVFEVEVQTVPPDLADQDIQAQPFTEEQDTQT